MIALTMATAAILNLEACIAVGPVSDEGQTHAVTPPRYSPDERQISGNTTDSGGRSGGPADPPDNDRPRNDRGPADPGPAGPGPADPGPADPGPADPGPADPDPADPGPPEPPDDDCPWTGC
jgi:hypothetical protein